MLIISNKSKLQEKYGDDGFNSIREYLLQLKDTIKDYEDIDSTIIFVDAPNEISNTHLDPVFKNEPHKIQDLIKKFSETNGELENLLIIGGHDIIPFHEIPDPLNDEDRAIVYSDSIYSTIDDDYLLAEWAVGRIPDSKSNNPKFLIVQIKNAINAHQITSDDSSAMCCTAKVWRLPSERIYENIKMTDNLIITPLDRVKPNNLNNYVFHYFNLHGSDQTPTWYGDDDNSQPIAVDTNTVDSSDVVNSIILSEACYGAFIIDKTTDESMSLKYLEKGARCIVGSTAIAYGSSSRRLFAADMIADKFFRKVRSGMRFGEAFWKTKIEYYADNYGDGRNDDYDAKTLIEFVLYGDPTLKK